MAPGAEHRGGEASREGVGESLSREALLLAEVG